MRNKPDHEILLSKYYVIHFKNGSARVFDEPLLKAWGKKIYDIVRMWRESVEAVIYVRMTQEKTGYYRISHKTITKDFDLPA